MRRSSSVAIGLTLLICASIASPAPAQQLGVTNTFKLAKRAIYQVKSWDQSGVNGIGTAFAVRSTGLETDLLTASHVLHPAATMQPSEDGCNSVSFHPGDPDVVVAVRSPEVNVLDVSAAILADDYCSDLALISISTGSLPILCLQAPGAYRTENHIADQILLTGFLPPYGAETLTPISSIISSMWGAGKFRISPPVDPGMSGAPVLDTKYGLVVGIVRAKDPSTAFSLAGDPQALENFVLRRVLARWITNPDSQNLAECRGF